MARIELESTQVGVQEIIIHPDWRSFTDRFDADIAILVLKRLVEFTNFIQPVCLPKDENIEGSIDGVLVRCKTCNNCSFFYFLKFIKIHLNRWAGEDQKTLVRNGMKTFRDKSRLELLMIPLAIL